MDGNKTRDLFLIIVRDGLEYEAEPYACFTMDTVNTDFDRYDNSLNEAIGKYGNENVREMVIRIPYRSFEIVFDPPVVHGDVCTVREFSDEWTKKILGWMEALDKRDSA